MVNTEERLIRWTIGDIADGLHALEQRLFYKVEVEMCESGKVKPGFNPNTVSQIHEAKQNIGKAEEILTRITTKAL